MSLSKPKQPSSADLVARALAQRNEIYLNLIREELQRLHEQYQERDRSSFQSLVQRFYRSFFNNSMDQSKQRIVPTDGVNSRKLKEIDYSGSIPEQYICPLTMDIMSEPCYVRQHPNQRFEKSWILTHLQNHDDNPLTREPMTTDDLIDDTLLKSEISEFVEAQIHIKKAQP
jgi:hypothetical protein